MCSKRHTTRPFGLFCAIIILFGIILPLGSCQNAEPRGSLASRNMAKRTDFLQDELHADETDESWDASPEGKKQLDENARSLSPRNAVEVPETEAEVAPRAHGNRNKALLPTDAVGTSSLRPGLNVTTSTSGNRRRGNGGDRSRKKRRRGKETKSVDFYDRDEFDVRENEIRDRRGPMSERRNGSRKSARVQPSRKYRAERRRRRKNRERKRGRKRNRMSDDRIDGQRSSKLKRRMNDAPASLVLGKFDEHAFISNTSTYLTENFSNATSLKNNRNIGNETIGDSQTTSTVLPSLQDQLTTESYRRSFETTPHYGSYADTVEREFSKQLEREISRTRMEDPTSLENRILGSSVSKSTYENSNYREYKVSPNDRVTDEKLRLGNSRYDAEKMLGYSKTDEDTPILDLENEVLARTLKDYNAYMATSMKLPILPLSEDGERRKSYGTRFHGKPIIDDSRRTVEGTSSESTTTYDEDNATGDLSCINGSFVPAPLSRHALIKYVKSSVPGHEYLEADYECTLGFYMISKTTRLLCRNRQWIGQIPKCKIKQSVDGPCAEASCDHVCKEVEGRAVCSCYKGFRLEGNKCIDVNECKHNQGDCEYKCINTPGSFRCECPKGMKQGEDRFSCIDINECLLNNGHGPCQDTCRNFVGGYECSCDGLQDTVLSPDNHTCQDAGPCSVNNAGCSHTCLSTMGRVFCLCPDGFILEDDWRTCQDVDECAQPDLQAEMCRYGCINTPGSYRCADPTELRDQPVLDSLSITCLPGYEATPDGVCIDINECMIDNGGCTEVCENTDGSFFCACDGDEKALSSDGKSCVDINNVSCPPLNPAGRGYLMCTRSAMPKPWRGRRRLSNRPGTKCFLKCPYGYQLHGEYELTCRSDGTWDGPKHGECLRYSRPRLECPKDVVAELPPGRDEAFVTFDQPSTDLDWFRYVRSEPSWGTRLEANLKPGVHEVKFFARHPISKRQATCTLRIIVKGGEAPKVLDCPNDIEVNGRNGTAITWIEPIFTDNVKVTRIKSNESPGHRFDAGGHRIEYEAADDAGWSSKCVFTVVLRPE